MVAHFNGKFSGEMLKITVYSQQAPKHLQPDFDTAYDAHYRRILHGRILKHVVSERM